MTDREIEPAADRATEPDGGTTATVDEGELYVVVRTAVKDALLDILGTVFLLGFAFVFVIGGAGAFLRATDSVGLGIAVGAIILGFVLAAYAVDLGPGSGRRG